jgi:hypothetical protein
LAATWPYQHGGPSTFVRIDPKGRRAPLFEIAGAADHAFLGNGEYVVSSDGNVRDGTKGEIAWRFGE